MSASEDQIRSLPGSPEFSSKQYSGFLAISATKKIHYYYIESEVDPVADSIVFWTNGGPGCSGLIGLFTELGPWRPQFDGTLARNPASWTSLASVVFLEQPAGVGYSTTTDPNELVFDDYKAARDNVLTIKEFFKRHPERVGNTMYLASESYGGHYIPQLTLALLADADLSKNFEGFLVGNPYTSFASGDIAQMKTLWGLQLVDYPLWSDFTSNKCDRLELNANNLPYACINLIEKFYSEVVSLNAYALTFPVCEGDFVGHKEVDRHHKIWSNSAQARTLGRLHTTLKSHREVIKNAENMKIDGMINSSGQITSETDLTNGVDLKLNSLTNDNNDINKMRNIPLTKTGEIEVIREVENIEIAVENLRKNIKTLRKNVPEQRTFHEEGAQGVWNLPAVSQVGLKYNPCAEDYAVAYLNSAAVQHALHIIPDLTSPTVTWSSCSDPVFINWNLMDVYSDTTELYSKIYSKVTTQRANGERSKDFRMLVFSGDTDGICATVGTQHWIYSVTASKDSSSATSSSSSSFLPSSPSSTSSFFSSSSSISTTASALSSPSSSSSLSEAVSLESIPSLWQPWVIVTNDTDTDVNSFTGNVKKRQQGGFLTKFDGSFSFATVHSAGHEVPAFQPVAALSIFAGFLDGSIFSPSVSLTTTQENKNLSIDDSRVIAIVIIVLCSCGLGAVCLLLRSRERKIRRGSCGPPVSTIESGTDAEEDEGRAGPGTLTTLRVASLPTSLAMSSPSKNKYIPMATEEDNH